VTFPTGPVTVPDVVDRIADGREVSAVWVNELGGATFSVGAGVEFVKVYPDEHATLLAAEAPRLRWARRFTTVPEVVASGPGWLHTRGLPGRSAVDPRWADEPRTAARAIGAGLRRMHDAPGRRLPVRPPVLGSSRRPGCRSPGGLPRRRVLAEHADGR
jgi:kanamycin kinase